MAGVVAVGRAEIGDASAGQLEFEERNVAGTAPALPITTTGASGGNSPPEGGPISSPREAAAS